MSKFNTLIMGCIFVAFPLFSICLTYFRPCPRSLAAVGRGRPRPEGTELAEGQRVEKRGRAVRHTPEASKPTAE